MFVTYGEKLIINCTSIALPKAQIKWKLPTAMEFQTIETTLRLESFKFSDEGLYECEHSNDIEPPAIRKVRVRGEANNWPNISKPDTKYINVCEGDDVNLLCHCEMCEPLEVLMWIHENQNHQNETNNSIEDIKSDELTNQIDYPWKIENVSVNSSGTYTCYMKNAFGFDTYSIELNVKKQPKLKKNLEENTYRKCTVNKVVYSVQVKTVNGNLTFPSHVYDCSPNDMNILLLGRFKYYEITENYYFN